MSKILSALVIILMCFTAQGQTFANDPLTGRPYMLRTYDDIKGSANLYEEWKPSNVTDKYGTTFLNVMVRFDAYINKFFYNHGDTAYEFVTDIREVELFPLIPGDTTTGIVFKKGFSIGDKIMPNMFVQVLAEGKVIAVKHLFKTLEETTEYNVPGKIKSFAARSVYYFKKDGVVISQKPGSKPLEELLKDKWPAVESYMKENSLSAKNEADFVKAIRYYNSL